MPIRVFARRRLWPLLLAAVACASLLPDPPASAQGAIRKFQTRDGRELFTNVPEKFRNRADYAEVKFEHIAVAPRFRKPTTDLETATKAEIISHYARLYGVNENLVYAIIKAESAFDPQAVSSAGARGLMQLMPGTAADMGVTDIFDIAQNIAGGTQYIAKMLQMFDNNLTLALAAYNAGPGAVQRHGGVPPYRETQDYVRIVPAYLREFQTSGTAHKMNHLARVHGSVQRPTAFQSRYVRPGTRPYLVEFKSGLTQPADSVEDKDPYWRIVYGSRSYEVRKDIVAEVRAVTQ